MLHPVYIAKLGFIFPMEFAHLVRLLQIVLNAFLVLFAQHAKAAIN
jgi:hypothetical protein